jgi:hypothetical protein
MFSLASTERPRSNSLQRGGLEPALVTSPWRTRRADSLQRTRPLWGALDSRWSSNGSINDEDNYHFVRFASVDKDLERVVTLANSNGWRGSHDHNRGDRGRGGRRRRDLAAAAAASVSMAAATASEEKRECSVDPETELPSVGDILQTRTTVQAEASRNRMGHYTVAAVRRMCASPCGYNIFIRVREGLLSSCCSSPNSVAVP